MKTVITATEDKLNAEFDKRFGRAAWFCVFDDETSGTSFYDNANLSAEHGAGTKAAEKMAELGASKVISGDFGPNAKTLLDKLNIQMVIIQDDGLTVEDIIGKLKK